MHKLLLIPLLLASFALSAAEDFTLWSGSTFAAPYTNNVIATSSPISNNNGLESVKVVVSYDALTPDRATAATSYSIQAVIEEEIATGVWTPIAYQFTGINDTTNAPERIMILTPELVIDVGQDNVIYAGGRAIAKVSSTQGTLPGKFRVKLLLDTYGDTAPLTSVTISAYGRKF